MKLISFAVPSYNSESYLNKCLDSLIPAGDDAEIIIINDGSTDSTLEIAQNYQSKYPNIVKVIDQENGGHGSGVNNGLKAATGLYYKVIDSDDWVDEESLRVFLNTVKIHLKEEKLPDLYITNFIYEKVNEGTSYIRNYEKYFKTNEIFTWDETLRKFKFSASLLMHALIYKTETLKSSEIKLPKHTFYVDNIFAYEPLPFVRNVCYLPIVFYHYYIGRSDQSIQMNNIIARYKQQIRVMKIMFEAYDYYFLKSLSKGLSHYMFHCLNVLMIMTQMFTIGEYSKERKLELKALWKEFKLKDKKLYRFLKYRSYSTILIFLPWRLKSIVLRRGYLYFARKIKLG